MMSFSISSLASVGLREQDFCNTALVVLPQIERRTYIAVNQATSRVLRE